MKIIFSLFALVTCFSLTSFADVRPPGTPPPTPAPKERDASLTIELDKSAKDVRLVIPKAQVRALRAQLDEIDAEPAAATAGWTRAQVVFSGLFMSLGIVFAGVWLARSRKISTKTAVAGAVLFLSGAALMTFANVPPEVYPNYLTDKIFSDEFRDYEKGSTPVKISVSDKEREFRLIFPREKEK
jgi:hypothetical protein